MFNIFGINRWKICGNSLRDQGSFTWHVIKGAFGNSVEVNIFAKGFPHVSCRAIMDETGHCQALAMITPTNYYGKEGHNQVNKCAEVIRKILMAGNHHNWAAAFGSKSKVMSDDIIKELEIFAKCLEED